MQMHLLVLSFSHLSIFFLFFSSSSCIDWFSMQLSCIFASLYWPCSLIRFFLFSAYAQSFGLKAILHYFEIYFELLGLYYRFSFIGVGRESIYLSKNCLVFLCLFFLSLSLSLSLSRSLSSTGVWRDYNEEWEKRSSGMGVKSAGDARLQCSGQSVVLQSSDLHTHTAIHQFTWLPSKLSSFIIVDWPIRAATISSSSSLFLLHSSRNNVWSTILKWLWFHKSSSIDCSLSVCQSACQPAYPPSVHVHFIIVIVIIIISFLLYSFAALSPLVPNALRGEGRCVV